VSLTVTGDPAALPAAVDVSAYRAVETLLTDGAGPAGVHVARSADGVRIRVTGAAADPHGTRAAALEARVSAWGGSYRVGGPDGTVEVFLPSAADVEVA
jgi:hypothetical protein